MAMSTEDRIAARNENAARAAAIAANGGVDPELTSAFGITDPDLAKYLSMASMPSAIAWGDPNEIPGGQGGGSRSQETAARKTYKQFQAMGGQAELDRIQAKIAVNPTLQSQLQAVTAAGNKGDFFSKIGDAVVRLTPTALKVAALAGGADLAMGGTLFGTGATGAGAAGPAAVPSTVTADPIAAMTGAGTGVSDAAALQAAMASPGAITGAAAGNVATGLGYGSLGGAATGGMNALSSLASPELAQAAQTLAQNGITQDMVAQAATNPSLMQRITDATGISSNTLSSLISGGASLYGGYQSANAAKEAAAQQAASGQASLAEMRRQFDIGQENQQPWMAGGREALGAQLDLMGLPGGTTGSSTNQLAELMKSPGYEFRLGEGQKAVERSAAARGGLFSGGTGKALTEYGQNFGTSEYGNRLNQLSALSGTGQSAASGMAGQGANYAANFGNMMTGIGNVQAAGTVGAANARQSAILGAGNALQSLFNPPKQQQPTYNIFGANYGY